MDSTRVEETLEGVAIIGLSGRFPGAAGVDEFWRNLRAGVESIKFFSDEELLAAGVSAEDVASPGYVKASAVLEGIELFDAPFFGFSPREAEIMDPQLRFFLEGSWEALENAGYNSETYPNPIGVFGGMYMSKYLLSNLLPNRELTAATGALQMRIWNDKDFLASLVAYKMNLRGPSVTIQTACSTSLVAVCMACQSLLNYQCDMALAGGVTISVPHNVGSYAQEGVLSPDGHCRAFDDKAQGTVGGNGMGVVLLKRLADAVADGDTIYAVLKGWAINNDGSAKIGYTAPSVEGQMEVIGMAQALARVDPETVTYIETHGTGTPLGDPIEITALTEVFRAGTDRKGFCAVGSVKTNIGHLDAAAGVSSLIKTVQALRHKEIPPSLNFERPNSEIDFENSPFFVNSKLTEWKRNGAPLRAGVSSFAMGGVNAHVIVEEAPELEESSASRPYQLLVLSARTNAALENVTKNLAAHLRQQPELKLSDVAYTLQVGRKTFNHRRVLVCHDTEDAVSALETLDARRVFSSISDSRQRNVVFMFPGQGTQYVQMAAGLYADEPAFSEQLDLCAELLSTHLKLDLRDLLYPLEEKADEAAELLGQTRYTQPALFAVEYALARVWMQWGIKPQLMIGHSVGEYVAACLAGVMTLEDALSLVAERALLMQQLPAGAMLAVSLTEEEVQPLLRQGLSLASVNGPSMCVVSGLPEVVNALHARLSAQGVDSRLLHTSHAFHSEMVDPILQKFAQRVKQIKLHPPAIPYISNLTGNLITEAEATDALYWAKHLRHTVRFADGLSVVLKDEHAVLVEVGPGRTLSTFCKQHPLLTGEHLVLSSVRHPRETTADLAFLLSSLGRLWLTGMNVDWSEFYGVERRRRVALPTYPFERQRCWIEPPHAQAESTAQLALDNKRLDLAKWFYTPLWKQSLVHQTADTHTRLNWLVFVDEVGLGARVAAQLKQQGHEVTLVRTGIALSSLEAQEFAIDPRRSEDYEALLSTLVAAGRQPERILHLWSITSFDRQSFMLAEFERTQTLGSHSLLRLAGAVTKLQLKTQVIGVSNDLQAVIGDEQLSPEKATLIGACQVVAERGMLVCRCVDVSLPAEEQQWEKLINRLCTEFVAETDERIVAYRGNRRWVPTFEQVTLDGANEERTRLRTGGVYFFAGDVTRRTTRLALSLAQNFDARIALLLPAETDAQTMLELEATGDKLLLLRADSVTLENAFAQTVERFGEVHGVVYTVDPAETSSLIALTDVLKNRKLHFCLLQSQLSPMLGDTGVAASYFAKSLASRQSRTGSVPWISMQWDGWPEDAGDDMTTAEALQVVSRTLSTDLAHVLVSPTSLQHRIQQRSEGLTQPESLETTPSRTLHQRLDLPVEYIAPRNEDEERLAGIWKQFLGFEQIGVHDNFFDLGGHSLLATQLISRVRTSFNVTLPLETLFAAPTVAGFAEQIREARHEQENQPAPIERAPRDGALPLSFAQQRMWFFDQLESSSSTYNIPCVLRAGGAIDIAAFELSLNEIVRRHEILRTTYAVVDEQPVQVIAPELELAVSMIDVSDLLEFEREERAQQLVAAEVREPFNLATGPLVRVSLIRMKEEDHILVLTLHHILADGWSLSVLLRELEILYHAHANGQPAQLAELPIQYADFARWQRESMQGEAYEAQLDYWKQQLADPPGALDLPTDRPRQSKQTFNGAVKTFTIAPETYQALHAVNSEEGTTLFMTLLATYQTLLNRYTGQDDIVVGSAIANRNRAELEVLIGFFVNTLALRTRLTGDPSFRELLRRVREVALGAYAHQDVPFEQLVELLHPVRDASRPPLFQTMLVLQNAPLRSEELSGLTFSSVPVDRAASMFDLTLYLTEMEDGLSATVEYNTDLFDEGTIERLANHFEQLLGSIAANPDERLSRLSLLTPAEERRLIAEWNDTAQDYPRDACLHQLFEQQVERTPHDTALICGERQISFAELNRRANQLARYLQTQGVGPDTIAGLMIDRSIEMVVALLGVLKAGAAYVPLDPAYPQERLSFMLEDSEARVLVTEQHLIAKFGSIAGQRVVCIDDDWPRILNESTDNLDHSPSSNSVAYVIYTSGSTGQPKGVMGLHKGMANRFQWMWERYPFEAGEVCCHKTSLSFLDSVWEIFGTLAQGVPVVIIPSEVVKDVDQLVRTLAGEGVTRIVLVPSLLRLMLDTYSDLQTRLPKLKIWVSSGEALSFELAQRFKKSMPQSVLLNLYGSSEASADSTWFDTSEQQLRGIVPIGRPIANTSVYIFDRHLQLVPTGATGELYIGGDGLARGYWKRASLTAEKFIPNWFGPEAGARLYHTGDLARFLPDGTIEYVGRVDHQVKIRGMRLELGEIETALTDHPLVRQAVVVARQDSKAELQLAGYIVPVAEEALEIGAVRQFLRQRLPEHMVPAAFVLLDELPLTPNGKVNRRALPAPDYGARHEMPFASPETQTEIDVAHIWSEVLHGKEIGIDDNFFDLGGHSLLATQAASRLRKWFDVELPLRELFDAPTVRELAQVIDSELDQKLQQQRPPIRTRDRNGPLALSYAQQRLWFLDQLEPHSSFYNIPAALRLKGRLDLGALEQSFAEVIRRHESLRTRFSIDGNEPVQLIDEGGAFALERIDLSTLPEAEREAEARRVAAAEAQAPFDLSVGPLVRASVLRLGAAEHVLLCTMHHIVSDGWSMGILIKEVTALYEAFSQGKRSPLPELTIQYADFAQWQREWLQGEVLERQLSYWKQQLAGAPAVLELPLDHARPAVQRYRGAQQSLALSAPASAALRELSQRHGVTLFMTLLAAWQTLLARYSGQQDVVVGTPIAGRNHAETEALIGFFINTLVLRTDLSGDPRFVELLGRVREVSLGAYANQDVPFEKLVEELQPERSLNHSPLFQVMLVLQNAPQEMASPAGLELSAVDGVGVTTKFDLTLSVSESAAGLVGTVGYNTDLFAGVTIARMMRQFEVLLENVARNPEQRLSQLEILSAAERRQVLEEWNETAAEYPVEQCIHELFAEQVERTPDAVAVVYEGEALTYAELNARANQLAHYLQSLGVGPEVLVGLCVDRSVEMVVGLLGILKAGGAYLPLDPSYPQERLAYMLGDTQLSVLLTQQALLAALPPLEVKTFCLDSEWALIHGHSTANPSSLVTVNNLAYVIYTSGSTGSPKGVQVEHRGIANLALAQARAFQLSEDSRVLQFASLSFDAAVSELFKTWLSGGTLCLAPSRVLLPGQGLLELLREQEITAVTLPPSVLAVLPPVELPALETIIAAGEACSAGLAARWAAGRQFCNAYGPTETTVCATINATVSIDGRKPSIGKAMANMQVYILDAAMQPVPVGVSGELYVGGVGVARGYLNRSDLTAERFVPDMYGPTAGARLYRTGDLARFRGDGEIEYLGRIDNQVKVRGFRIELGEIEAALLSCEQVREAAVLALADADGERRLVAYVVSEGEELASNELSEYLASQLPQYMLPSAFVMLEQMPLTLSGKLDRLALPAPGAARRSLDVGFVAAETPLQQLLVELWQQTLLVDQVGIHDNFFAIGGDSIRAAIFINKLQQLLGEYLYVVALFDAPTIAELAAYLEVNYTKAVARWSGGSSQALAANDEPVIDAAYLAHFRSLIPPAPALPAMPAKLGRAVFILSAPRSGSTLLRVMLAGHPELFAPPELELLGFTTLAERAEELSGRNAFWREGLVRALMQLRHCDAEEAQELTAAWEADGLSVGACYGQLQQWLGERLLVDKTPSYALDLAVLRRAEELFTEPLYVHLVRDPRSMIGSFEEAKLDQVFFRPAHELTRRQLAELIWVTSEQNIAEFLSTVSPERQLRLRYEDLVREPQREAQRLSEFLGVEAVAGMMDPYAEKDERMTDGIHPLSKMMGDVKFHEHAGIEASGAEKWRQRPVGELWEGTWALAARHGYAREASESRLGELVRVERSGELALSYAQQRLWFLDQLEPNSSFYNIPAAVRLKGSLDLAALEESFAEIVRRHESLRTRFSISGNEPIQVIDEAGEFRLQVTDLSQLEGVELEAAARRAAQAEAHEPFELSVGPLFRARVLRLGAEDYVLLCTMHHIVSDGWSMGILIKELTALYEAFTLGQPSPLPELTIQYADYAQWQRGWLHGELLEEQLNYWKQQLAGAPAVLELPLDHARPAVQSFRGAQQSLALSAPASAALRELSQRHGVTLFMTLLASWQLLLSRYSGQQDIVVGTPIAGRNHAETEALIGFFINTLVLRTDLSGDPSFIELLGRVREVALGAYAHQDVPFEKLVEELQPERDRSRSPLFQVMLVLQNVPQEPTPLPGLQLSAVEGAGLTTKFDLTLSVTESAAGLVGMVGYNTDLFEGASIARMMRQFEVLLEQVGRHAEQRLSQLQLMRAEEREQLLVQWNETAVEYPAEQCIHELFAAQVERAPEAVAVVYEGEALTYAELNARANQLAHYLQSLGVGPETLVGLCVERSVEMVVGLLAILKAGGAYVPLDPSYPQERLAYMLGDTQLSVLLTQQALLPALPPLDVKTFCLDSEWALTEGHSTANPSSLVTVNNLAYVIYTSGSTGRPKGVQVEHRGIANLALAQARAFQLSEASRVLQFASLSFDAAVSELFKTWLSGGTLCLAPSRVLLPGQGLLELLHEQEITAVTLPPSVLAVLPPVELPALETIIAAGEACSAELAARWGAGRQFCNAYGPTETTVCATINATVSSDGRKPSIGKAMANMQVYILDAAMQPVPVGVSGELYVGGVGVSRGYLNRSDLTAERFVPDPYGAAGARLYRTGDLARFRGDGEIEYLGRIDNQVKVRGFRIELGEIEAALLSCEQVREAAVLALADADGERRLVAYVVSEGEELSSNELSDYLASQLPQYMLPSAFVMLEQMPLTLSGKLDRRALPAPGAARRSLDVGFVAAETPLQQLLVDLWQQTLLVDQVGIHDNFFAIGGDSIRAAIFINKLQQLLGEYLYVVALFDAPTIAELAAYLEVNYVQAVARWSGGGSSLARAANAKAVIDAAHLTHFRSLIPPAPALPAMPAKLGRAVFILSAPRSGSTLLRVMLAGHPELFAPPELELLGFTTLADRAEELSGRNAFWREGLVRALMQLRHCDAEQAQELTAAWEAEGLSVGDCYRQLQRWLGQRLLVDKTPSYALDRAVLQRAEELFTEPLYVHLVRDPRSMIGSFEEAKLDQVFFRPAHELTRRQLAELIWITSEQNIAEFLATVSPERQLRLRYEDLVREPQREAQRLSEFLGVEAVAGMMDPYAEKDERMTDGIHPLSKMMGDVKFHDHKGIEASGAEKWRERPVGELWEGTWAVAAGHDYEPEASAALVALKKVKRGGALKLSYAQQRLWFLDQLEPHSSFYNIPAALRLKGRLDLGALEQSFAEVIRRHESLRTRFSIAGNEPVQLIDEGGAFALERIDLSTLPEAEREAEARRVAAAEAQAPFDLSVGPLVRARVLRLGAEDHVLLCTMHHIVSDGWSMGILIKELTALYEAFTQGEPSPLPELTIQYADFAQWQREWLQGEVLERQLSYWKQQLAGVPAVLELPLDHARPAVQRYRGAHQPMALGEQATAGLKELSQREGVTLFMTLLAAWQTLLARYSGQQDVVVGTPIAGRNHAETEALIGFFINTLVLRTNLSGDPSFIELLGRVREVSLGAYANQDVPFEKLVEELQPERSLNHSPLFQVMLVLQNAPQELASLPGLELSAVDGVGVTTKFDLTLSVSESAAGLVGTVGYNTDLFAGATIARMMRQFEVLLENVARNPEQRLSQLEILSAAERRQVLEEWNETAVEYPRERSVAELFEEVAVSQPHSIAVEYEGEQLSYEQLNSRANQLAHYLRSRGVGPEVAVGIMLDRSLDLIVGLVAILKAGGAYVPLDPQYPQQRLSFMLADSRARLVITQNKYAAQLSAERVDMVLMDEHSKAIAAQSEQNLSHSASSSNLAYIIYTSGSTGQPKGVMIEHRSVLNLLQALNREVYGKHQGTNLRISMNGPLAFDTSVKQFIQLLNGHTLYIVPEDVRQEPSALIEFCKHHFLDVLDCTPTMLEFLLAEGLLEGAAPAVVLVGGEPIDQNTWELLAESQRIAFYNVYGPTECTVNATVSPISKEQRRATIGRSIPNVQVYILGRDLSPVAIGVRGEIYIGGAGVGRGYTGRPELTAERFVPDPYSGTPGGRLYKTGDQARYFADGKIDFIGRIDHQVKVRGYRIELGEIEAALEQHPSVAKAAVVVSSDLQILAYVVAASSFMDHGLLRSFVADSLPHYMIPSSFITLESLPLTPSGKFDRLALPDPPSLTSRPDRPGYNPDRPSQTAVAEVWAEVLRLDHVALDDNFFELGGHSLLATQAASRLRKWFDIELPLRKLFEAPTVRGLAQVIDGELGRKLQQKWAQISARDRNEPVALSYAQQRLWFLDQLAPGSDSYNIATAIRMEGRLDEAALRRALKEIVKRHEALRTRIELIGTEPYQVIDEQVELSLPVIDHSELAEQSKAAAGERLKRQEASEGFNLSTGPLIKAKLIKQGAQDHLLLVTMHHIISDGWSMGVLVKEVSMLYEAFRRGEESSPLGELPVQYADYALWQREWLQGEVLDEQLKYWEEKLVGAPVADLPTDRARGAIRAGRAGRVRVEFDEELTRSVKQESRKQGLTLYMLLMGVAGVLLTRYSRSREVVIGSPIANRVIPEVEGLIGFFVNTLALRVRVDEEETVEELLKRVREEVLGAYAHQDVPYEKVVERVQVERAGEAGGLFQVMLSVQNAPRHVLNAPDLTLTSQETYSGKAKFDLLFVFYEEGSRIKGSVTYNSDLFDDDTINLMVHRFTNLLKSAVGNMQQPVSSLSMLGDEEIGGVTLEDFPEIELDQQDLENLILELSEETI